MGYRPEGKLRSPQRDFVSTQVSSWVSFAPPSIQGLALWLDASDSSTITESGGAISQWNDKSGNGKNATQASGTAQPAYISAAQNGLNAIQFDGTSDNMVISDMTISGSFTVFVAAKFTANTLIYEQSTNSNTINGSYWYTTTGESTNVRRGGVRTARNAFTNYLMTSEWLTAAQQHNGTNLSHQLWKNDVSLSLTNSAVANNLGTGSVTSNVYLFSRAGSSFFGRGDLGEFIIYNNALNYQQISRVGRYLREKWGTP